MRTTLWEVHRFRQSTAFAKPVVALLAQLHDGVLRKERRRDTVARGFLGHASVVTTSNSYVSKARRVTGAIPAPSDEVSLARAKGRAEA